MQFCSNDYYYFASKNFIPFYNHPYQDAVIFANIRENSQRVSI